MKTLFSWISGQQIYFIESREVVVPPRMHRLSDIGKSVHWDTFELRSRIFIPAKYDHFCGSSEICLIFQWLTTFSQFGISPNGCGSLIVILSALYTFISYWCSYHVDFGRDTRYVILLFESPLCWTIFFHAFVFCACTGSRAFSARVPIENNPVLSYFFDVIKCRAVIQHVVACHAEIRIMEAAWTLCWRVPIK